MRLLVVVVLLCATRHVAALVGGAQAPFVKFRYHGEPRVKCMNCKVGGENLAPALIGDGVVCVPVEDHEWDCEVPEPVRRFWVSHNHTELVVVINRSTALTLYRDPSSLVYNSQPRQEEHWSFYIKTALCAVAVTVGRFGIAFMRGPVSGHLTSWWLSRSEEKRKIS